MIRVLLTGENSYIGNSFKSWIETNYSDNFEISCISLRKNKVSDLDLSNYDCVVHLAAIVHRKNIKEDEYNAVNRDLTYELAKKCKQQNVSKFVFLSTMGVYGIETGYISSETRPNPKTDYAKSKLDAEVLIKKLGDDSFIVSIIRPPIVYGPNCVGNYNRLSKLIKSVPIFPNIKNERSMIYIDELSDFLRLVIVNNLSGIYFPQSKDYVSTVSIAKEISRINNKNIIFTKILNPLIRFSFLFSSNARKVFGSLKYDKELPGIYNQDTMRYYQSSLHNNIVCIEEKNNE